MTKPDKELLDFMIYDKGYYETLEHYGLTDDEADVILYGVAEKPVLKPFQYRERKQKQKVILWSKDIRELRRVIGEHFWTFLAEEGGDVTRHVDSRSMSPYDIFMQCITDILEYCPDFHFISDEQTQAYIRSRLKRRRASFDREGRRYAKRVPFRDDMLHHGVFMHPESENPLLVLKGTDREIMELFIGGFTQVEIGDRLNMDQTTVSRRIRSTTQKLKKCLQ